MSSSWCVDDLRSGDVADEKERSGNGCSGEVLNDLG